MEYKKTYDLINPFSRRRYWFIVGCGHSQLQMSYVPIALRRAMYKRRILASCIRVLHRISEHTNRLTARLRGNVPEIRCGFCDNSHIIQFSISASR